MQHDKKIAKMGFDTQFSVQPMEILPTSNLADIPISQRKCLFPHENGLYRFQMYSQSACELECKLEKAEKVCLCLPWYYPDDPKKSRFNFQTFMVNSFQIG